MPCKVKILLIFFPYSFSNLLFIYLFIIIIYFFCYLSLVKTVDCEWCMYCPVCGICPYHYSGPRSTTYRDYFYTPPSAPPVLSLWLQYRNTSLLSCESLFCINQSHKWKTMLRREKTAPHWNIFFLLGGVKNNNIIFLNLESEFFFQWL